MAQKLGLEEAQEEACLVEAVDPQEIKKIASNLPEAEAYRRMSELFKLLGDRTRLRMVVALLQQDLCVHELVALLNNHETKNSISQSGVSHQLRLLRTAQIVQANRQGQTMRYSLIDDHIRELVASSLAHAKES